MVSRSDPGLRSRRAVLAPAVGPAGRARSGGGPPAVAALLHLQRSAGNRAVSALLGVQRYTVEQNYTFGAAHGQSVLQSQGLRVGSGTYVRVTKSVFNGALMATTEAFNPAANHGAGAWQQVGRPALVAANPPLKVSENGHLALEQAGQAKLFYITAAMATTANTALAAATAPARVATTGVTITVPAAGARPARALTQATATAAANPTAVAEFEDAHGQSLRMQVECHDMAKNLINRDPTTAPPRARRRPRVGEAYHFKARPPGWAAPVGGDPVQQTVPFLPTPGQRSFRRVLDRLTAFDAQLAQVSETFSMLRAMGAAQGRPDTAKALLPGWGDHSEAVIARDGDDRLTLANYNRATEAGWVASLAFRQAYRGHQAFRQWFRPWYTQTLQQQFNLAAGGAISAEMLALVMTRFGNELLQQMGTHVPQTVTAARRAADSAAKAGQTLWYFDMYGPAAQSFQRRFRQLGARRMGGSQTTVV